MSRNRPNYAPMQTSNATHEGDGGFVVTQEMYDILAQPGYLSWQRRSQRLRDEYQDRAFVLFFPTQEVTLKSAIEAKNFDPMRFTQFALACFTGDLAAVRRAVTTGVAPDLTGSETPYKFGYVALVVTGAQRLRATSWMRHIDLLKFLLASGAPPDVEDIVGYTALHHATMKDDSRVDMARILLEKGADPNHQNRYGAVPILDCFQTNQVECVDLLMEFGADLSITDADGVVPSKMYIKAGPKIAAVISKWEKKRNGEETLLDEKKCRSCGKTDVALKICSKCHTVKYCSAECQRKDWSVHKISCRPFSQTNTVTLKPRYKGAGTMMSTSEFTRAAMGLPTEGTPSRNTRSSQAPRGSAFPKSIVIKVQVPWTGEDVATQSTGDLLVYTKKRDFVCTVQFKDDRDAYKRISEVVRQKGVGGAKAYFAAELMSKDELVVKVDDVLAAQPF
ncbi:hypothetical protein EIP91_006830 [Steccherinum ochraceum]|uniref:MYND-type domain-containing protein n=1 Tax=Steccherinum ochraceum TaxID=92696 RepID=A0A4R0R503_9APHY|nr:hypothetical protein EIP91_006830 [Steccherinum ochraceum]